MPEIKEQSWVCPWPPANHPSSRPYEWGKLGKACIFGGAPIMEALLLTSINGQPFWGTANSGVTSPMVMIHERNNRQGDVTWTRQQMV